MKKAKAGTREEARKENVRPHSSPYRGVSVMAKVFYGDSRAQQFVGDADASLISSDSLVQQAVVDASGSFVAFLMQFWFRQFAPTWFACRTTGLGMVPCLKTAESSVVARTETESDNVSCPDPCLTMTESSFAFCDCARGF